VLIYAIYLLYIKSKCKGAVELSVLTQILAAIYKLLFLTIKWHMWNVIG